MLHGNAQPPTAGQPRCCMHEPVPTSVRLREAVGGFDLARELDGIDSICTQMALSTRATGLPDGPS
eukprot:8593663-Lingulodinium_polyedra.AAC.1